ncbi:tetratricopeptide repeat protein [Bernardetia sp.]|uniref:type IX secretion system periplasmic lipoprotein PorW/SprE n=1 Tax=Bernardetia sp. TaxID=1937974 RepID=UPI0025BDFCF8|nr:outer membrane protein assembly factor BamD [Bernardetia sp.]
MNLSTFQKKINISLVVLISSSFIFGGLTSCQFYRNTASRFNAYFLAKERFDEVYKNTYKQQKSDFNNVLTVLPAIDSVSMGAFKGELDYVIEKASLPIQRHPESDWTDDSYLLIGKARLHQADYRNAINSFKYLNGNSEALDVKHAALIWLMRSFIESGNLDQASFTMDYISEEGDKFSEENIKDFYLVSAHYYRTINDFDKTAAYLELALPYVKNKTGKARYHFILGQIYQNKAKEGVNDNTINVNKFDRKAYQNYEASIKAHPEYEMVFNAQLNASQVAGTSAEDIKQAQKYFEKLLKDQKNEEYKDRIYYEMAGFAQKRGKTKEAIELLQESLNQPSNNSAQRAYTYVRMGELYYAESKYAKANAYYDSALAISTEEMRNYDEIAARGEILNQFFQQYDVLQRADTKISLSKMSQEELVKYFEKQIAEEKAQIDKEVAAAKQAAKSGNLVNQGATNPFANNNNTAQIWYFYNEQAVRQGKNTFVRVWKNRPLEDNWRRSNKVNSAIDNTVETTATMADSKTEQENLYATVATVEERLKEVPSTKEEITLLEQEIEGALFELGKVYHYQLKEDGNARATFDRFIKEYPKNKNIPEALFILRKMCLENQTLEKCDVASYEKTLQTKYPESTFAKLISNPDYLEQSAANDTIVTTLYEESYTLYSEKQYEKAIEKLDKIRTDYPQNSYNAKIELLRIMSASHIEPLPIYVEKLNIFVTKYEGSKEQEYAKRLLEVADEKLKETTSPAEENSTNTGG